MIFSAACTKDTSTSETRLIARPRRPARAVLPTLWTKFTGFLGSSELMTRSTEGTSRPLLAISVATNTRTCWDLNLASAANLRFCDSNECNATFSTPTCERIPDTKAARSQVATKTMVDRAFPASSSFSSSASSMSRGLPRQA